MRILLLNPPHTAIGSRIPNEHLPPFGLLCLGGPLIDAGHDVRLLNADPSNMTDAKILDAVVRFAPDVLMVGHSGSTSAHPSVVRLCAIIKPQLPELIIVYGGVYPSYHWRDVLETVREVDVIVRGEGEATVVALAAALDIKGNLEDVPGLAFRQAGVPYATRPAPMIRNLDDYRIGWELIDFNDYSYWAAKKR